MEHQIPNEKERFEKEKDNVAKKTAIKI